MSLLWRLLNFRAGHQDLPGDIGPDPEPDEPDEPEPLARHLRDEDFERAALTLNVPMPVIRAVAEVESSGHGFLPSGRTTILWESHIFGRLTEHRHAGAVDARGRALSARAWDRTLYGPAGEWQWDGRLLAAAALPGAHQAAHQSASYGLFQLLGTNATAVGSIFTPARWQSIDEFVDDMNASAAFHLDAFIGFIRVNRLDGYLRNRRWRDFARRYNGPGFASHRPPYDRRLAEAYARWRRRS